MKKIAVVLALCAAAGLALGCSAPAAPPAPVADAAADTASTDTASTDTASTDTVSTDTATTDTATTDSSSPDTSLTDTAAADADSAGGDAADAPATKVFAAIPGARCAPAERIGLVSIYAQSGGTGALDASATIEDIADPRLPKSAKLSDAACGYFEQAAIPPCGSCPPGKMCGLSGGCVAMPVGVADVKLVLTAGGQAQTFAAKDANGAYGSVTLPGKTFAAAVHWAGLTVTLAETSVPPALADAKGKLAGTYDKPAALDLTWTPPADAATLFTHIPINHHAGAQTFTECAVPATAGKLHVDAAMLLPLSVVTGLEFQGIEHVRFAAAQTPLGCVELRFQTLQYVDLGF